MKSLKVLFITAILTVACVTPVLATEKTLPAEEILIDKADSEFQRAVITLSSYDDKCGSEGTKTMTNLLGSLTHDVNVGLKAEKENYINYLKACLGNAIENERIKKQNVEALKDVVKANPSFQPQLDAAIANAEKAVTEREAAEQAIEAAKAEFVALSAKNAASLDGKTAVNTDAPAPIR